MLVSIAPQLERPRWLRAPAPAGENYRELKQLIERLRLHTVCESAACPNVGECWNQRTATFMMLGNVCTRRCGFCAVEKGPPLPIDYNEPQRIAEAVAAMGLRFAVITARCAWVRATTARLTCSRLPSASRPVSPPSPA